MKDPLLYLMDTFEAVGRILEHTEGMSFEEFVGDEKTRDAVEIRFQILGEAVKKTPSELKRKYPQVPWKEMADFRDVIVHDYFGIDYARV